MPQLVKKRRSGWAVLAVGALVASILAAGATPAAATARKPDFEAQWKACLGPAMADQGFTDVSESDPASHYGNINCLAYYGITIGRTQTPKTFAPDANVTRSQMALFLARAADAAGIDLGDATDHDFTDLEGADAERADAIKRVVGAGIMFGDTETSFDPPSETLFAPTDHVTRWEMAMFLFEFLNHALEEVLVDTDPKSVDGDSADRVELGSRDGGKSGTRPDDDFRDARRQTPAHVNDRISALYELGVTLRQPGEKGTFDPNDLVTRAQMASFIMRTLGHTNLRPEGLTAQSTNADTQVSMREKIDNVFVPIGDVRTEVFTTNFPDDAFDANGACILRYTRNQAPSFDECKVDVGDHLTSDDEGNALWEGVGLHRGNPLTITCTATGTLEETYTFMAGTRGGETDYTVYAWNDSVGETANLADLFKSEPANRLTTLNDATKAVVTGGNGNHIPMGSRGVVKFTVQLRDENGNPVGPTQDPDVNNLFSVQIDTYTEKADDKGRFTGEIIDNNTEDDPRDDTVDIDPAWNTDDFTRTRENYEPNDSGVFTFTVRASDPARHVNDADRRKVVTVRRAATNTLNVVDMTTPGGTPAAKPTHPQGVQLADLRFSDNAAVPTTIAADAASWRLLSPRNRNSITVEVLDQYGKLYRGGGHEVKATDDKNQGDFRAPYAVSTTGRRSIGYTHDGDAPLKQTVTLQLQVPEVAKLDVDDPATPYEDDGYRAVIVKTAKAMVNVYWADRGDVNTNHVGEPILLGARADNAVIVNEADKPDTDTKPIAYWYGSDDKFVVEGEVVTMDQFEEILDSKLIAGLGTLSWVGYDYNRPRDGATWSIDGLSCTAPGAGD